MDLAGIPLSAFAAGALRKVPAHLDRHPDRSFDVRERLGDRIMEWIDGHFGRNGPVDLAKHIHHIPMQVYRRLTADELCKLVHVCPYTLDKSVDEAFDEETALVIYRKIVNSMWRWGVGRSGWNEVVDAYDGIRRFDLGHPEFEVRLDHTTFHNERGWSKHSRTFLDGVFGYLVHHRGRHVMTIGFSVMKDRRILLQQVQLKGRHGNRWLYRLPRNYLEHVIDRMRESFPRHRVFVVDGRDAMERILKDYRSDLENTQGRIAATRERLASGGSDDGGWYRRSIDSDLAQADKARESIAHAESGLDRVGAFYAGTGRFGRGKALTVNRQRHFEVTPSGAVRDRSGSARPGEAPATPDLSVAGDAGASPGFAP